LLSPNIASYLNSKSSSKSSMSAIVFRAIVSVAFPPERLTPLRYS
jgi:hypothetical protein